MSIAWRQERSADRPAAAESIHFLIYDIPKTLDWRQLHDTLTHIKFDGSRMDRDSFVAACTALRDCTAITHLGFTNSGITDTGPIGELLCFLPRLTDLFLGNNLICGLSEQFVGGLAHCPNIMQLSLSRNYIRDFDGLGYVIGEHCPRLQSLNIRNNGGLRLDVLLAALAACTNITVLSLSKNQLTDEKQLAATLPALTKLQELYLDGNPLGSVREIAGALVLSCPALTTFQFANCLCEEDSVSEIVTLAGACPALRVLHIDNNRFPNTPALHAAIQDAHARCVERAHSRKGFLQRLFSRRGPALAPLELSAPVRPPVKRMAPAFELRESQFCGESSSEDEGHASELALPFEIAAQPADSGYVEEPIAHTALFLDDHMASLPVRAFFSESNLHFSVEIETWCRNTGTMTIADLADRQIIEPFSFLSPFDAYSLDELRFAAAGLRNGQKRVPLRLQFLRKRSQRPVRRFGRRADPDISPSTIPFEESTLPVHKTEFRADGDTVAAGSAVLIRVCRVVAQRTQIVDGTGTFIRKVPLLSPSPTAPQEGYLVTAAHLLRGASVVGVLHSWSAAGMMMLEEVPLDTRTWVVSSEEDIAYCAVTLPANTLALEINDEIFSSQDDPEKYSGRAFLAGFPVVEQARVPRHTIAEVVVTHPCTDGTGYFYGPDVGDGFSGALLYTPSGKIIGMMNHFAVNASGEEGRYVDSGYRSFLHWSLPRAAIRADPATRFEMVRLRHPREREGPAAGLHPNTLAVQLQIQKKNGEILQCAGTFVRSSAGGPSRVREIQEAVGRGNGWLITCASAVRSSLRVSVSIPDIRCNGRSVEFSGLNWRVFTPPATHTGASPVVLPDVAALPVLLPDCLQNEPIDDRLVPALPDDLEASVFDVAAPRLRAKHCSPADDSGKGTFFSYTFSPRWHGSLLYTIDDGLDQRVIVGVYSAQSQPRVTGEPNSGYRMFWSWHCIRALTDTPHDAVLTVVNPAIPF
eukprot:m.694141 g.694141  ORF g.694141 m.694141 type:complete len:980 (-) comp58659_c1_seq2:372-3311(-)